MALVNFPTNWQKARKIFRLILLFLPLCLLFAPQKVEAKYDNVCIDNQDGEIDNGPRDQVCLDLTTLLSQAWWEAEKAAGKETVTRSGVKTRTLAPKGAKRGASGKVIKGAAGKKAAAGRNVSSKKARTPPKKVSRAEDDSEAASADEPALPARGGALSGEPTGQVSYKIYFTDANSLTTGSEKRLKQVAETMGYYPMANIQLIGYAYSGEPNADALAENRVNLVATRLSEKYRIDRSRMDLQSKVTEATKSVVEIKMTGKE